jgi:hypothetical protein
MTWFQVWVGEPRVPAPDVLARMKGTAERGLRDYILLTDAEDQFAGFPGSIYPWSACCADHPELRDALRVVRDGSYRAECVRSDVIRFWYAGCHSDVLYVDCDCTVKSLPEFKAGSVWFARYGTEGIEHLMFYSDDRTGMQAIFEGLVDYGRRSPSGLRFPDTHRLLNEWFWKWPNVIEPECFDHG